MTSTQKIAIGVSLSKLLIMCLLSPLLAYGPVGPQVDPAPLIHIPVALDTIPMIDRQGDFIHDPTNNPFDILPSDVDQSVEYDPDTDTYIIYERIGDEYFRTPTYMTFDEYLQWRSEEQETRYFEKLAGLGNTYKSASGRTDPMTKIDIEKNLIDRLFGGNGITIEPQGSIDLNFGARYTRNDNSFALNTQQTRQFQVPIFDMDIQMNVDGKIGDKLDLGFNYDTNATFDFDQEIALVYNSEEWTEDDIIKKIEAGNVSLPLRSSLIQGAQELFGIKSELQFGRLRLTGVLSQQRSSQGNIQIENGATVQEFELKPQDYDENRHFFLSHYHVDNFEQALENLPYINSNFRITNLEVWVSDDRANFQTDQTMICALADIGEPAINNFTNPSNTSIQVSTNPILIQKTTDVNGDRLPDNRVNNIFDKVTNDPTVSRIEGAAQLLEGRYGFNQTVDMEIFRGRKLSQSEYFYNPELGFVSLNVRLRPNQVLAVAYEYFYTGNTINGEEELYKVGATTDEASISNSNAVGQVQSEGLLYTKLIKPSSNRVDLPTWDLMMKNVYPMRSNQLNEGEFEFDIFYENDDENLGLVKFLPINEGRFRFLPLLNLFGLDNLNSRLDPQPDGRFDFVPGVTVVPSNGSLIFPKLEPFGDAIAQTIDAELPSSIPQTEREAIIERFAFTELYDTSLVVAEHNNLVNNKFTMIGKVRSAATSEYSLGAWNVPQGSVTVTAGSVTLTEGVHYEVDYGIGRVRILDQSIVQQGVPVNVSFEDNSAFSLQQKNLMGLRAEYEFSENFYVGGTALRLQERPFTQKVNFGDDPIKNRIFGLDVEYSNEAPLITKIVDKLPFFSTNQPSNINFSAEVAALRPGHNRAINSQEDGAGGEGIVSLDDFEGAVSGFPLSSQPNRWTLASVPSTKPESRFSDDNNEDVRLSGVNRARVAWYIIDRFINVAPDIVNANPFTRRIQQPDLFDRQIAQGQLQDLLTFDLTYFPDERGPYNYDRPQGTEVSAGIQLSADGQQIELREPETRWAGVQRYLNNNDFEAANYEFIEFWMLDPYGERPNGEQHSPNEFGNLTFHLGNVSEDILQDGQQFYENTLPQDGQSIEFNSTQWGNIPLASPIIDAFGGQNFTPQDLGLDGLSNADERSRQEDYINDLTAAQMLPPGVARDPAGDDFVFFNNDSIFGNENNIIERYKFSNNPQGNSPNIANANNQTFQRGNPIPDKEDLNNNRSLDSGESYYEYKVPLGNDGGQLNTIDHPFIRDVRTISSTAGDETWYRFRIPLNEGTPINGISGFRSIQFIRIIMDGFATTKTFRLADFELIRSQWRRLPVVCEGGSDGNFINEEVAFSTDVVGFEENQAKTPFGYVIPEGIVREQVVSNFSPIFQDENALVLRYDSLKFPNCALQIAKLQDIDLRVFNRMQMFVHGESCDEDIEQEDGDMSVFIRLGKDYDRHYYEYEIPLTLSERDFIPNDSLTVADNIWPLANRFDFPLQILPQVKKLRNLFDADRSQVFEVDNTMLQGSNVVSASEDFRAILPISDRKDSSTLDRNEIVADSLFLPEGHKVRVIGNPNLGLVKGISIGVRSNNIAENDVRCGEIWVNELRLAGLQERSGAAGLARLDVQLADLGNISASTSFNTLGWGALDQRVNERAKEASLDYDVATNLELGKFFPENWGIRLPFYGQYAKSIVTPEFDSYDEDITVKDQLELNRDSSQEVQDDIRSRNRRETTIRTFNLTNVRKEKTGGGNRASLDPRGRNNTQGNTTQQPSVDKKKNKKPLPWNIENFSASYSYTNTQYSDELFSLDEQTDQQLSLDYSYSRRGSGITPFKKLVKSKNLKFIKELNFNPFPNSFSFQSTINRSFSTTRYRLPVEPIFEFDDRRFDWTRGYDLNWNLTKALKLNFSANNVSYIDELRQTGIAESPELRDWKGFENDANNNLVVSDFTDRVNGDPTFVNEYWKENLRSGGRNTNYDHNLSVNYTVPTRLIPYMDWIDIKGQYRSTYSWAAGALVFDAGGQPLAGVIQNSQNRSVTANFSFDKLYKKSKYVSSLDKIGKSKSRSRASGRGDEVTVSKGANGRTTSKKKQRAASTAEKLLLRPLFSLRSARLTYREEFSTIIPGFTNTPEYFGLDDKFSNPGLGFVAGLQPNIDHSDPNNFLQRAATSGRITNSVGLNQEVIQSQSQNIEAKVKIEPWKDFKIDVDFKKSYSLTHSEVFKRLNTNSPEFGDLASRDVGSFDITFYNARTLFGTDIDELFAEFEGYRPIISARLPNVENPKIHQLDGHEFTQGFGGQSSAVLVPAFLAAYSGQDPNLVDLDLESTVRQRTFIPKPNWTLRYDGLRKLPWFKDRFSSFTLEHGYSSRLRVSNFFSDVQFDAESPFLTDAGAENTRLNGNYFTRVEVPAIQISEDFNPVIGVKLKTKKELVLEFEYVKSRDLNLKINTSSQLEEDKQTSFVFGFGYTIKDSKFLKKKKKRTRTSRSRDEEKDDNAGGRGIINRGGSVTSSRGSDMTFMLNIAWNDNQFFVHELDTNRLQSGNETRGEQSFQISPSVDYILNDNLTLRAFMDYNNVVPYASTSFRRTNVEGGIVMRLSLN